MIKQIELPSAALVRQRIEEAHAAWNANMISYQDLQRRESETKAKKVNAEIELSQALDEGFQIIERYPFSIGDGLHLVLYRMDDDVRQKHATKLLSEIKPRSDKERS